MSIVQALLLALWVWIYRSGFCYPLFGYARQPLVVGFVVGVVLGDIPNAMIAAVPLQLIYMGMINTGGNIPTDTCIGSIIGISTALLTNATVEEALTIAVPVGLLANQLMVLLYTVNGTWVHRAEANIAKGNINGFKLNATLYPMLTAFVIYVPLLTLVFFQGPTFAQTLLNNLPEFVLKGLSAIGMVLPALGFAVLLKTIENKKYLAFFVGAYFVATTLALFGQVNLTLYAVIGLVVAYLFVGTSDDEEGVDIQADSKIDQTSLLDQSIVNKVWTRWWIFAEVPHSYERLMGLSFSYSMLPALEVLYPDKEDLQDALLRHMNFFNTQAVWGGWIVGTTLSLEEQVAQTKKENRNADIVTSTKIGLMGPLAGVGDSLDWGTLRSMVLALMIGFAAQGHGWAGILPVVLYMVASYLYGGFFVNTSYTLGKNAVAKFLTSDKINSLINMASVLGLIMSGILVSRFVKIVPSFTWTIEDKVWSLAGILDSILPGILPFATVMGIYMYFDKKGLQITKALLYLTVGAFILGAIGIL